MTWVRNDRDRSWSCPPVPRDALAFHRSLSGYRPTPLVDVPRIADELGVGRVLAKDESERLGRARGSPSRARRRRCGPTREQLGIGPSSTVLLVITEGAVANPGAAADPGAA